MSVKTTGGAAVIATGATLPYTGISTSVLLGVAAIGAALLVAGVLIHYFAGRRG